MSHVAALKLARSGDAGRIVMAHGALAQLIAGDLRVIDHYHAWVARQALQPKPGPRSRARTLAAYRNAEIDLLAEALRRIGVPWRWCAETLIDLHFPAMRHNVQHPTDPQIVQVSGRVNVPPPRRLPRTLQQGITRDVRWWYQVTMKQPPDTISDIAKKDVQWVSDHESRAVVEDGVAQAELLLNLIKHPF